jgi:hypothetical protein
LDVRYRVEYLTETTEEETVCVSIDADCDLATAEWFARARGVDARKRHNADGFQIRDLDDAGRIVALETFEEPLSRFRTGDEVIH